MRIGSTWRWLSGRSGIAVGIAALTIAMFAFGYWLGGFPPDAATATPHPRDAAIPEAGPKVARLEDLLPALEAKVAANPRDLDQRLLLARTYAEIGQRDKAIRTFRVLRRDAPANHEVTILLATLLMDSADPGELRESNRLLEEALRLKPAVAPMVRLYQGEISMRLGDRAAAIRTWKDYLRTLPADDPRRAMFEQRIAGAGGP